MMIERNGIQVRVASQGGQEEEETPMVTIMDRKQDDARRSTMIEAMFYGETDTLVFGESGYIMRINHLNGLRGSQLSQEVEHIHDGIVTETWMSFLELL